MKTSSMVTRLATVVLCLSSLGLLPGCGKRAVSSAGDELANTKDNTPAAAVEAIKPDHVATIPDEPRPSMETARAPLAPSFAPPSVAPSSTGGTGSSSTPDPSTSAFSTETGIGDIYFDYDQYTIRRDAQPVLEANATWLKSAKGKTILIEGHCDERGTLAYNLVLGEKRARSAKRYLEDLGVPASRMKIISYGEVRPFCKEHEDSCWQKNRRVHFVTQ